MKKIFKVVAFLLLTAGILYMVMWWTRKVEGFQSIQVGCVYTILPETGGGVYLCDSLEDASAATQDTTIPPGTTICYTDSNTLTLGNSQAYTCFDATPEPVFDSNLGVYRSYNSILDNDPMPGYGRDDVIANYTTFGQGYAVFMPASSNISTLQSGVNLTGLSNISTILSQFNTINTNFCSPPSDTNVVACRAVQDGIAYITPFMTDTSPTSLSHISTVLQNSYITISTAVYTQFLPGFYNSGVMSTAQIIDYLNSIEQTGRSA
jgi:hypothetical protein